MIIAAEEPVDHAKLANVPKVDWAVRLILGVLQVNWVVGADMLTSHIDMFWVTVVEKLEKQPVRILVTVAV